MPDYLGDDQRKLREEEKEDKPIRGMVRHRRVYQLFSGMNQLLNFMLINLGQPVLAEQCFLIFVVGLSSLINDHEVAYMNEMLKVHSYGY